MTQPFNFQGEHFVFPPVFIPPSGLDQQYPQDYSGQPQYYQPQQFGDPLIDPSLAYSSSQPPSLPHSHTISSPSNNLRIKIPAMAPTTRGAARQQPSSPPASGSEYHESNASMDAEENPQPADEEEEEEPIEYGVSSRGRRVAKKSYQESEASTNDDDDPLDVISPKGKNKQAVPEDEDEDEDEPAGRYALRRTRSRPKLNGFIVSDEEDGDAKVGRYPTRNRTRNGANGQSNGGGRLTRRSNGRSQTQASSSRSKRNRLSTRRTRSSARPDDDDEDGCVDEPSSARLTARARSTRHPSPLPNPK